MKIKEPLYAENSNGVSILLPTLSNRPHWAVLSLLHFANSLEQKSSIYIIQEKIWNFSTIFIYKLTCSDGDRYFFKNNTGFCWLRFFVNVGGAALVLLAPSTNELSLLAPPEHTFPPPTRLAFHPNLSSIIQTPTPAKCYHQSDTYLGQRQPTPLCLLYLFELILVKYFSTKFNTLDSKIRSY